jgi:hypothetical protein
MECLEQFIRAARIESHPRIPNRQAYAVALVSFGPDHQLPGTTLHFPHRIRAIPQQVEDDLLELEAISDNLRQIARKLRT